jgi:hypothetical protein
MLAIAKKRVRSLAPITQAAPLATCSLSQLTLF